MRISVIKSGISGLAVAPLVKLRLAARITGILPIRPRALARRSDVDRQYQRTTSDFVPFFPRRASARGAEVSR